MIEKLKTLSLASILFACFLLLVEYSTHTNFVVDSFLVDYVDVFFFSSLFALITHFREREKLLKNHWKNIVFIIPIYLIFCTLVIYLRYNDFFRFLVREDSVVEWMQFIFLLITSCISFLLSVYFFKKNIWFSLLFALGFTVFVFLAAEEISWGQRVLNIETPAEYAQLNVQNELTIHNHNDIFGLVYRAYMIVGFAGGVSWFFKRIFSKYEITVLLPDWQYSLFFLSVGAFNYYVRVYDSDSSGAIWEEMFEFILILGIFIFFFDLFFALKKTYKLKESK